MDSSTFLTQVQEAESKAAKLISDAKLKAQKDLQSHSASLQADEQKAEETTKQGVADKIAEAQAGAKQLYEDLLAKGQQEADALTKKCEKQLADGMVAKGKEFFMTQIVK